MPRVHAGQFDERRLEGRTARPATMAQPEPDQRPSAGPVAAPGAVDLGSATRTIGALQHHAGNAAVAQLLGDQSPRGSSVQRDELDEQAAASDSSPAAEGQDGATELDDGGGTQAAGTGQSWTKVGPPKPTSYTVTGTLRKASETVEARTEAGSVTTTPSMDADPPKVAKDGSQTVPAVRVTAAQVMELPVWSSRAGPESNGGQPTANQEAEWNRFSAAIAKHEAGHVAKDQAAYANAHTTIKGKSPTDADTEFDRIVDQATADNDKYDTANDHGRKEGTTINPNIDEVTKVP